MTTIAHLLAESSMGSLLLKVSALLLLAIGLMVLFRRAEPRWRVAVARTAVVLLPLLMMAHFWIPKWELPIAPAPQPPLPTLTELDWTGLASTTEGAFSPPANVTSINWSILCLSLWVAGMAIAFSREIWRLSRIRRAVQSGRPPSPRLNSLWRQIESEFSVTGISVKIVSEDQSPFVAPGIRRIVAVPQTFESDPQNDLEATTHALRHEAAHLQSGDGIWIPMVRAVACVLWFHPLVWWLAAAHLRACEEACDAAAARKGGIENYRRALAQMALDLVPVSEPAAASFLRAPSVMVRLRRVVGNGKLNPPRWWVALPVLTLLCLLSGGIGLLQVTAEETGKESTMEKLKLIQIPKLEFIDTPLTDAISYLAHISGELDETETDPARKGLNFIVNLDSPSTTVTLKLSNISLEYALRYTVNLGGATYRIDPNAIVIESANDALATSQLPFDNPRLQEKAARIILPKVEFQDTPFQDALEFLRARSRELDDSEQDPTKKGVNILLQAKQAADTRISLRLSNVPLSEALRYCTQLAQLRIQYDEAAIIILPPADDRILLIRTYEVPDWFLDEEHGKREGLTNLNANEWLTKNGITRPDGSSSIHNPTNHQLIVRTTEKQHELIARLVRNLETVREVAEAMQAETKLVQDKLKLIMVPMLDFRDTPLLDALEFLRMKSVELDDQEPDPAKKGINIIVRANAGNPSPTITLRLSNVPLIAALNYTAELSGMKVEVQPHAVLIVPAN